MAPAPRPIDRKRWRAALISHVEDFPRQLEALQFSTEQFGGDFDLHAFVEAFESQDPRTYSTVQAVERGFARLQNYMASMAEDGARLAELQRRRPGSGETKTAPDFEALRDAGVITKDMCRTLIAAQKSRSLLEHAYVGVAPEDVHAAIVQILDVAPKFLTRFVPWIEPYLLGDGQQ